MRTVPKQKRFVGLTLIGIAMGISFVAFAGSAKAAAGSLPTTTPPTTAPVLSAPAPAVPSVVPSVPVAASDTAGPNPDIIPPAPVRKEEKGNKGLAHAEDKIADSVKDAVKQLDASQNVTLDDLNTARQAIAKIDALIEIEKRLTELEKYRTERNGKSMPAPLPASALMPLPSMPAVMPASVSNASYNEPAPVVFNSVEITRISGNAGHYTAFIKGMDGQAKPVQVGDTVPGSGKVRSISASGVELDQNGFKRFIRVKNVETVFSQNR